MVEPSSLINLGELSKPATVLIKKISDAIGGIFKPYQIRRVAQAEAEAKKIEAVADIEITEIQQRALFRFIAEESKKQSNIESITSKALPELNNDSKPNDIEDDWITNFFDKCRLISDEEMQILWSKVLSGEANSPGKFSKRTVDFLSSLDKSDAILFDKLCGFCWIIGGVVPLIYDYQNKIYNSQGIDFNALQHLDNIGLISFNTIGFLKLTSSDFLDTYYYDEKVKIKFRKIDKEKENKISSGLVMLTKIGGELAPITNSEPVPGFLDYILGVWSKKGLITYSDWPRNGSYYIVL